MNLSDAGVYQYFLSIEFVITGTPDAFVVVEVKNYDVSEIFFIANGNTRVVSRVSEDFFVDVTVYDPAGG